MRKLLAFVFLGGLLFVSYQCSVTKVSKEITSVAIPTKEQILANYTAEQLSHGKEVWKKSCIKCHDLHPPEDHTRSQWNPILKRMIGKSKLDMEDGTAVYAWIMAYAKDD